MTLPRTLILRIAAMGESGKSQFPKNKGNALNAASGAFSRMRNAAGAHTAPFKSCQIPRRRHPCPREAAKTGMSTVLFLSDNKVGAWNPHSTTGAQRTLCHVGCCPRFTSSRAQRNWWCARFLPSRSTHSPSTVAAGLSCQAAFACRWEAHIPAASTPATDSARAEDTRPMDNALAVNTRVSILAGSQGWPRC